MSSYPLTSQHITLIKRLVSEVSAFGMTRDILREHQAAHTAAIRIRNGPMSEAELRAVIYDGVFGCTGNAVA